MMHHRRRYVHALPLPEASTPGKINVLQVHEERLGKQANVVEHRATIERRPGRGAKDLRSRTGPMTHCAHLPVPGDAGPIEGDPGGVDDLGPAGKDQLRGTTADARVGLCGRDERRQAPRLRPSVVVQRGYEGRLGLANGQIVAGGKAQIALAGQNPQGRRRRRGGQGSGEAPEPVQAAVAGPVINDDDLIRHAVLHEHRRQAAAQQG